MTNDNKVVGMEPIIDLIWTAEDVTPTGGLPPMVLANWGGNCSGGSCLGSIPFGRDCGIVGLGLCW